MKYNFLWPAFGLVLILSSCASSGNLETGNGNEERMRNTLRTLQDLGERSSIEKQWQAARYIEGRFREHGLKTEIRQYEYEGKQWPNVVATLDGSPSEKESVMAIAHLDSKIGEGEREAPGADDNGSGVAVLLEAARSVRDHPLRRKVVFAVFSREESGQSGSRHFATHARRGGEEILAVLNLDILGYSGPDFRSDWKGVWKIHGIKPKIKALAKMAWNTACAISEGRRVLKVVGKPPNEKLVRSSAAEILRGSNLKVKEMVRDDCG